MWGLRVEKTSQILLCAAAAAYYIDLGQPNMIDIVGTVGLACCC